MTGRRVTAEPHEFEPGDYGFYKGRLWCRVPTGALCDLERWTVVEHEDSTVTVTPSINAIGEWHGWLTKGEFVLAAQQ